MSKGFNVLHSSNELRLSRLLITGPILANTPLCVIEEIALSHGIDFNNRITDHISEIISQNIPYIQDPQNITIDEWPLIARFVNVNVQWPKSKLLQAYNHLISFIDVSEPLQLITNNFHYGLQTPSSPYLLNSCVLYSICIKYHLNVNVNTTIEQMAFAVHMLFEDIFSIKRRVNSYIENEAKHLELINILMLSSRVIDDPNPNVDNKNITEINVLQSSASTFNILKLLHTQLSDVEYLQQKISSPITIDGCIALAAINYSTDISRLSDDRNALIEYQRLTLSGKYNYVPHDPWLNYWAQTNRDLLDLTKTFNPLFPKEYYKSNVLRDMVLREGYGENEFRSSDTYELMQLSYVSETFYIGVMPNMITNETIIDLTDVSEVPPNELLCYGSFETHFKPITVRELFETFRFNQNFVNPFDNNKSVFSSVVINKLKLLARQDLIYYELIIVIEQIERILKASDAPTRYLVSTYTNASSDTKKCIHQTLQLLLEAGMYMRGWRGAGNKYPISKAINPKDSEGNIMINVTEAISSYESSIRSLGQIGTLISDLPLVKYRGGEYIVASDRAEGFTIQQRLDLVKEGDKVNNMKSCIRLSSNWICASAHKYLVALGFEEPFDIFNLEHIS